jgi:hypothetical protein
VIGTAGLQIQPATTVFEVNKSGFSSIERVSDRFFRYDGVRRKILKNNPAPNHNDHQRPKQIPHIKPEYIRAIQQHQATRQNQDSSPKHAITIHSHSPSLDKILN